MTEMMLLDDGDCRGKQCNAGKRGKGVSEYLQNAETLFVRKVIHKEGVGRRKGGLNRT